MSDASAPGKLVIVGEYAILHEAPAIVTAVGVHARAKVSSSTDGSGVFVDSASNHEFPFRFDQQQGFHWSGNDPGGRGGILQAVLETFLEEMPDIGSFPPLRISMDTGAFYRAVQAESRKLGLGSSAAVLVALVGALFDALGLDVDREGALRFCTAAHRNFQGGQGSGVDIAAAIHGGVLGVRVSAADTNISVDRLAWPDGLFILPVWSGESASTVKLLSRLYAFRDRNPDAFDSQMQILKSLAELANTAWIEQSTQKVLTAVDEYAQALRSLDRKATIGIITDAHEQLRMLTEHYGARYKTSGAGGGDFGFAYTDSLDVADAVRKAFADAGFFVLELPLATVGLTVNSDG